MASVTRDQMVPNQSVSEWIAGLKDGEAEAAAKLWERYAEQLLGCARRRLRGEIRVPADEEDIAQSVFHTVCRAAAAGRFADVRNRDELWWLLLTVTKRKVTDCMRRERTLKRGGSLKRNLYQGEEQSADGLEQLVANGPTPEFLAALAEQHERLMSLLRDESLRHVASSRIEGYTVAEIAGRLAVSRRSIERKMSLIRAAWAAELIGGAL